LVAKGFSQIHGSDYDETYAPVMDATTYRYLIALATHYNMKTQTMDVVTAYLYGELDHEIWMDAPSGHQEIKQSKLKRPVVRLHKALYGLKQSGRVWYERLKAFLEKNGFTNNEVAPCTFIKRDEVNGLVILAIYVDDLNIFGDHKAVTETMSLLKSGFEMKDLGRTSFCIGFQIEHLKSGTFVHQTTYLRQTLEKFNMSTCNPINTPMEVRGDRELYGPPVEGDTMLDDSTPYFSAIGALMWLANRTRPDIAFSVNVLARHTNRPTVRHWSGVKRIFRYLNKTSDYGILYQRGTSWTIEGYADAGFKSDPITAKSQGGYVFMAGNGAISWKSKKQTRIATSTAHAELLALYEGGREASWLWRLRTFVEGSTGLMSGNVPPIVIHEDNEACISQVQKDFVRTDASKHLDPMHHAWIQQEQGETLEVKPIPSQENTADIFTKALPNVSHWKHVKSLGLRSLKEIK
jgi:hypothetical protein